MPSAGSVTCDLLSGPAPELRERVETWQVPGIDGYGAQKLGKGDAEYTFRAVLFGTAADIDAWYVTVQALQGTIVTVTDDWATAAGTILVTKVSQLRKTTAKGVKGGVAFQARGEVLIEGVKAN